MLAAAKCKRKFIEFVQKSKQNELKSNIKPLPLVSVIVPVYNAEKTLHRCLTELTKQTYTHIEIICVDDGSTDSSKNILDYFAEKDKRIKVFIQKNSGPAHARNMAIKNAKGGYLMFCDSDDWYSRDAIEIMVKGITGYDVDVVMCDCNIINISDKEVQSTESNNYHKLHLKGLHKISAKNIKKINVVLWNKIFKKEIIDQYGIDYPSKYEQDDLIFIYKYLYFAKTYYGIDNELYNYVVGNPNSVMGKVFTRKNIKSKFDFIFAWQHLYDFLKIHNNKKNLPAFFKNDNFEKLQLYYAILSPEDQEQAYVYIKEFINKNPELLSNKCFKTLSSISNFEDFHKGFFSLDSKLTWYQQIFSLKNSHNKTHKIVRILGMKFSIRRKKK